MGGGAWKKRSAGEEEGVADSDQEGLRGRTQRWVEVRLIAGCQWVVAEGAWLAEGLKYSRVELGGGCLVLTLAACLGTRLLPAGLAHQESRPTLTDQVV